MKRLKKVIFRKTRKCLKYYSNIKYYSQKKESYGAKNSVKCFSGYSDDGAIRPLCIKLPQMIGYLECFDNRQCLSMPLIKSC